MTGGFVLGEVVILHQSTMRELAPLFAAALMLCVAAVCADRRRQVFWGRSLGVRLLPFMIILGLVRGLCEEQTVLAEQGLLLEESGTYAVGTVCGITEKESWTVLLLKNVQTEKGKLRYLQVYAERSEKEYPSEKRDSRAADRLQQPEQNGFRIGEVVRVWGEFAPFQTASNPGEFDYAAYYRGQKLVWRVFARTVQRIDGNGLRILYAPANIIRYFRAWAAERLKLLAGETDGSIFAAMLLGDRTGMPEEIRELYQKNGIAHLLAVSGLHLSLVSMAAYGLLRKAGAGYGKSAVAGSLILLIYSVLTGASPSVIRAFIMTLCGFLAAYLGRTYDLLSAMGLSALMLLWHSPYLIDQAGVQLSFAAIGGIGLAKEMEESAVSSSTTEHSPETECGEIHPWGQTLRLSLCMQLFSIPIILWHFFSYPLYGIALNLVVVPLTGVIVGTGAGGIFGSLFSIHAGTWITGGGCAVLAWYEFCCRCFMKLPGSSLLCGRPKLWQILVYYMVLGVVITFGVNGYRKSAPVYRVPGWSEPVVKAGLGILRSLYGKSETVMVFLLLAALTFLRPPAVRGLEVTILDTGQGDGICIRTKSEVILVDGGSTDQKELGRYRLEPFLKSMGIRQVDLAIVTHGDWDHISGISWLMEQKAAEKARGASDAVLIRKLAMPEIGKGEDVYGRLEQLCVQQGGEVLWIARGYEESRDAGLHLTCLYPESASGRGQSASGTDRNEHSLVFCLDYGVFHMLLTGDMSADGEKKLIALESEDAQNAGQIWDRWRAAMPEANEIRILKVAHHGSGYSSSEAFLGWMHPDYAVISCGEKNSYGHPHADALKRLSDCGSEILQTKEIGAIIWKTDGHHITWKSWKR